MLFELLKSTGQEADSVNIGMLQTLLQEIYGQIPSGKVIGTTYPAGDTATGTPMIARTVDAASVSSAAASPTNLKSFTVPAATPQILGLGNGVGLARGIWFYASGTTGAAANTKQITVAFGGSAQVSIVPIATTVVSPWTCYGTVLVRSNTSVLLSGVGGTCTSAGASFQGGGCDLAVTGLTLTSALTLQFQGVSAAAGAGDTIQDTLIVGYIP